MRDYVSLEDWPLSDPNQPDSWVWIKTLLMADSRQETSACRLHPIQCKYLLDDYEYGIEDS